MVENDLSYLIANDEQLEVLSEIVKRATVNDLEGIEKLEFLQNILASDSKNASKTKRETGASSASEPLQDAQSLLNSLGTICEKLKSIRNRKENIAVLENKKEIVQKMCQNDLSPFLSSDVIANEDPLVIARELERVEAQQKAEIRGTEERLEKMEKFVDDVQARLKTQIEEMDLRLTNENNLENECQSILNDFLLFDEHWIAEDVIQLRLDQTRINITVKFNKVTGDVLIQDIESFETTGDVAHILEHSKEWGSTASLIALRALRHRLDRQIRKEVEQLQNEFPLDWQPQRCSLQLLARGSRGQSVVCLLNLSDLSCVELASVSGLDIDSTAACALFVPPGEGSLRCWIDALIAFCASH